MSDNFIRALSERPELTGLRGYLNSNTPQIRMIVDEERAASMGVAIDEIYRTVAHLMGSKYINDFTRNGKNYRVVLQAKQEFRMTPESIGSGYVRSKRTGEMVPLSSLITIERTAGASSLARNSSSQINDDAYAPHHDAAPVSAAEWRKAIIASEILNRKY